MDTHNDENKDIMNSKQPLLQPLFLHRYINIEILLRNFCLKYILIYNLNNVHFIKSVLAKTMDSPTFFTMTKKWTNDWVATVYGFVTHHKESFTILTSQRRQNNKNIDLTEILFPWHI